MKCPKCGLEQPDAQVCASCGIVIEKFLARQQMASNPAEAVKSAISAVSGQIHRDGFFFSPNIPADQWQESLAAFPSEEAVGRDEEILMMLPEPMIGRKIFNFMDNTLITTRRLVQVSRVNSHVSQIDWKDVRTVALAGLLGDKIKINNTDLLVGALTRLTGPQKQVFLTMIKTIVRNLNQPGPGKPVKVTRLTEYASVKTPVAPVQQIQPPAPAAIPAPQPRVGPAMPVANQAPPPITPGRTATPQTLRPPAAGGYVPPPPPTRIPQATGAQADEDDDLMIDENPAPPVSPGRWLVAQVVGFLVGGIVGVPIGKAIGALIHLPGKWPYYLGLILGASLWTVIANVIKGGAKSS